MNNKGFTLVELAIVIVIIGLLVGGVLQGQELIRQAKIRSQIKQIENVLSQTETFRAKYNCLPADCSRATTFFGTTNKNGYTVRNGDGDQLVRSIYGVGAPYAASECIAGGVGGGSELPQFWMQLNDAGLGNYTSDGSSINLGTGYPATAAVQHVGMFVTCLSVAAGTNTTINSNLSTGNVVAIGLWRNNTNPTNRIQYITGITSWGSIYPMNEIGIPADMLRGIDEKTDDGLPNTGTFGVIAGPPSGCLTGTNNYPTTECTLTAGRKM